MAGAAGIAAGLVVDVLVGVAKAQITSLPSWAPAVAKGVVGAGGAALLHKHPTYAVALGVGIITPAVLAVVRPMIAAHINLGALPPGRDRYALQQHEMRAIQALVTNNPNQLAAIQAIEAAVDQAANAAASQTPSIANDNSDDDDDMLDDDDDEYDATLPNWDDFDFESLVD